MAWASRKRRWRGRLGPRRNDVVIATKFGVGYEEMPNRRDSSRARVLASIDKSLRRLRTEHVEIYLVHWPDPNTPLDETMAALDDTVQQGKARYIGVSNFRLAQIEEAMRLRLSMSCNTLGTCSTAACKPRSSPTVGPIKSP